MCEIVEILKIQFEKMHFLLYLVEYDLKVGVALCLVENSCKKKLVKGTDLLDI